MTFYIMSHARMSLISSCNRNKGGTPLQRRDYSFKLFILKAMTQLTAIWEGGERYWIRHFSSCLRYEMAGCGVTEFIVLRAFFRNRVDSALLSKSYLVLPPDNFPG